MISINKIDCLKTIAELHVDIISGGVLYLIIEGDTFIWRKASKDFDLNIFHVGEKLNSNSIAGRAIKENRTIIQNVPRSLYGMRLTTLAQPLVNEKNQPIGAFSIVFPRLHPVAKSFTDFAPILAEMYPEGAFIYMTDLEKIAYRQSSKKFDIPHLQIGYDLNEDNTAAKAIKTKKQISLERDSTAHGVPTLTTCYPLFDEDNSQEVVATLGIIIPKVTASNLRNMSSGLEHNLAGIASVISQLAASASAIHTNEKELNEDINEIIKLSEEINEVSSFISKIGNQTNMLGLNASIEAARAGELGKGFGVVAQEIRKLSEQSRGTVPKIKELTDSIKEKVNKTCEKSQNSLVSIQEQAAASEEITASIEEISSMSEELNKIAHTL
ncbi:methyl-accepting chemotaxis protein [Clostridium kluyveri]|uniref:Predicted methyl-accepting transducer n=2 Tax=Clostridium kluyveri TaxID=1534 RepID=A5N7K7_CLOK5|nr:methyl-accepting chemotaxis protein [Clostridium kluyveri]EDK33288.1 Predicted methyl-accepting transducer [Clostridium kluyveri DSM 555]BAH06194.1 hypothetical protein CKR_1143 [Clostridium kluyveri NBRC 12016]